jgi:release factor glutamine methyltransferase
MLTVLEIIKRTTDFFQKKGIESPRLDAELLIGHALELKRMQLYLQFERPLNDAELEKIRPLVKRRGMREPLQHIMGETEFSGLKLKVDRRALIPRPETEYLVELLSARFDVSGAILDLGTGSGAIALALARAYPLASVTAIERSRDALALAAENIAASGLAERVQLLESDWFSALSSGESFQLIVANPPYLSDEEMAATQPEVREFEPSAALTAGVNSAADLEKIIAKARPYLAAGGCLACETGIEQHGHLQQLAASAGYVRCESLPDLTARDRYLLAFV